MKTYTSQKQVDKDIKNGVLAIEDDIEIAFDGFKIEASIKCHNIYSKDYKRDINAWNINAWDITAGNINAWDITAGNINAVDIRYYAFCIVYNSITCKSWEARRDIAKDPICLDGELTIKSDKSLSGKTVKVELDGETYEAVIK